MQKPASFMLGAIAGDIIGSIYEWNNIKTKDFPLWNKNCTFTDDTVMSVAVYKALKEYLESSKTENLKELFVENFKLFGSIYPSCGYGGMFNQYLRSNNPEPYNSYGNGSAMRVSAAGFLANSLEEAIEYATASAEITHNHPEGVKGAVATAIAIYMSKDNKSKDEIRDTISKYYNISFTLDEIRPKYTFNETCQYTVPQAIVAFLESNDYEDAIRNAISIGGDSDTIAAITGGIAAAYYGIPKEIQKETLKRLDRPLIEALGYNYYFAKLGII